MPLEGTTHRLTFRQCHSFLKVSDHDQLACCQNGRKSSDCVASEWRYCSGACDSLGGDSGTFVSPVGRNNGQDLTDAGLHGRNGLMDFPPAATHNCFVTPPGLVEL
ncbi:hypothetical protein Bbelb_204040 [Branchiostoma belcheri]|nr:hypothetical protein Bbelb_204040 [Branchiostoma belcheri]